MSDHLTGLRLLLVDDEEGFVTTLAERLELRGLAPRVALNGEQALALATEEPPQVMVLDLRMPGMSGQEVLRAVKSRWPLTEVIMLTGHGSEQDRDACLALGAGAYHKKPLDLEVLMDSIRAAARRNEERAGKAQAGGR
jgi:DNA-binding response OmpR family regulator